MVSIKSIFVIALASFAIASPMFPQGDDGEHFDVSPGRGHKSGEDDGDVEESFFTDNDIANGDWLSNKKANDFSQNDFKSIQHNECGPKNMYVSCCNSGSKKAKGGLLGGLNLDAVSAQCSMLLPGLDALRALGGLDIIGSTFRNEQCKQESVHCCSSGNVNQNGVINVNQVELIKCSRVGILGSKKL